MAPDLWPEADGFVQPPPQPQPHPENALDRQMLRHLLSKYSQDELGLLIQEEKQSPAAHNDGASIISSSTYSSVKSEDAPSIFDSASIRTFSDTSSVTGSIISNVSARTSKFLNRKTSTQTSAPTTQTVQPSIEEPWDPKNDGSTTTLTETPAQQSSDPATAASNASKQKGAFMCGFCKEEGIQKTCTRKNDLKRHIEDFHNMNAQWFCRHRGCQMVFDWQTAYKTHLKHSHGGSRMSLDEAKVNLCPQTVFACGFDNCLQVFEAPSDGEAEATLKDYVGHVVKHFDEGANSGEWSYSARIRNLLRQSGVMRAWTNSSWPEAERHRLQWQPQSSGILRKRLETRHVGDLQLLIQYAIALGSNPLSIQKFREDFITPVKDECRMTIHGHKIRAQPAPAQVASSEPDPFQFKISRGTNPGLAAYLASQRRVYVPRPAIRAGRSARPPMHHVPTSNPAPSPMAPQYGFVNSPSSSPIFDPRQQQQQHPQHHQHQQQFAMLPPQAGAGIIADDLRSLRSMANSDNSETDIEMGDAQMIDPGYMAPQHHDFSSPYSSGIMQGTTPVDGLGLSSTTTMDQHDPFGVYDQSQGY